LKRFHYLLPILALLAGIAWSAHRSKELHSAEESLTTLRAQIDRQKTTATAESERDLYWFTDNQGNPRPPDWAMIAKETARRLGEQHLGLFDEFALLSEDELIAGLDAVQSLEIPQNVREALRGSLLTFLLQKNPHEALMRCDLFDSRLSAIPGMALQAWLEKDPIAALTWYDDANQKGLLAGKGIRPSSLAAHMEGMVLNHLFQNDPAEALDRIRDLPGPDFEQVLRSVHISALSDAQRKETASLIRGKYDEEKSARIIADLARHEIQLGTSDKEDPYAKVDRFLDTIGATPLEIKNIVKRAPDSSLRLAPDLKPLEIVEEMRNWAANRSPGVENEVTGRFLRRVESLQLVNFDEAADQALHYYESSGSEDLLFHFIVSDTRPLSPAQKDRVIELASKVTDESRRQQLQGYLR
jgi:hypothetical protein